MPIFSSQLGRVEEMNPEKGIKTVANHLRKLQEELEYRLMNLDSSNINEIDTKDVSLTINGEELINVLEDQEGNYSKLLQTVEGLRATVGSQGERIGELGTTLETKYSTTEQTDEKIETAVQSVIETTEATFENYSTTTQTAEMIENAVTAVTEDTDGKLKNYSTTIQTAEMISTEVGKATGATAETLKNYSTTTQTSEMIQTAVNGVSQTTNAKFEQYSTTQQTSDMIATEVGKVTTATNETLKNYSTTTQTSTMIQTQVSDSLGSYSTTTQTQSMIQAAVGGIDTSTMLRLDEDGFYIINQDGDMVMISGEQLIAGTVIADQLAGGTLSLLSDEIDRLGNHYVAGEMTITGAETSGYAVDLTSYGALRMAANDGSIYITNGAGYGHLLLADDEKEGAALQWGSSYIQIGTRDGASSYPLVWISGDILPVSDCAYLLGNERYSWDDVYAQNDSIITSDRNRKKEIVYGMDHLDGFFDGLMPATYLMVNGKSGRRHGGMIAQDVKDNLDRHDISTQDFAGYVAWKNEDGTEGCALRYGEFIPLLIDQVQKLKARVGRLEGGTV